MVVVVRNLISRSSSRSDTYLSHDDEQAGVVIDQGVAILAGVATLAGVVIKAGVAINNVATSKRVPSARLPRWRLSIHRPPSVCELASWFSA